MYKRHISIFTSVILAGIYFFSRLPHHVQSEVFGKVRSYGSEASSLVASPAITSETSTQPSSDVYWPGLPLVTNDRVTVLKRIGYCVGYSTQVYCPRWAAYAIKSVYNPESKERPESFYPDTDLPVQDRVETSEFSRTGYDRGHLAPNFSISFSYGREAQIETFKTTNICPQRPECNRHIWEDLEKIEGTDYARRYDGVVTFDGPIFGNDQYGGIGRNGRIKVPSDFYKIIVRRYKGQVGVLAFIIPQYPEGQGRAGLQKYLVSVHEIEEKTGIVFLTSLPSDLQTELKANPAPRLW